MVFEYDRFFAGELKSPPGKYSQATYQQVVDTLAKENPNFEAGAAQLYEFQTNYLQRSFDKGIVTKGYYDASLSRQDYVPLMRDMSDIPDAVGAAVAGGQTADLSRSAMQSFKGSQRAVLDPIDAIIQKVNDFEHRIARNDAVRALAKLAEVAGPGSGFIAEPIPNTQLRGHRVDVIEALRSAGKGAGVDKLELDDLILMAEDLLGELTQTTIFRGGEINAAGEPIVFYWQDGERRALRLADGRFGKAMLEAMTYMSEPERNVFALMMQYSQMMLRAGVTRAGDFILANFINDQFTSTLTGGKRFIPFFGALRGIYDILKGTETAQRYAASGGFSAGAISNVLEGSLGIEAQSRRLDRGGVFKQMDAGHFLKAVSKGWDKLTHGLEISEGGTRVGLFRAYFDDAKARGFSDEHALFYAKAQARDYIDYQRNGAQMEGMRRWFPFLNAAIQGTDKELRVVLGGLALERKRANGETLTRVEQMKLADARVAYVKVLAYGFVLGTGAALMGQGDEEYEQASHHLKNRNFLVRVGQDHVAIPKGFGIVQSIANLFERATEYASRQDPELAWQWLKAFGMGFVPPMNNPLVTTLYDAPANYDRFREGPIVPFPLQGVKPSEQYTHATPEFAKMVGQLTGWSPMKIEYVVRNMGGSLAHDFLKTGDLLMGEDTPEKQIYDWPIARRFVKNLARGSEATTAFYHLVGEKNGSYEQAENAYRFKIRSGDREGAEKFLREMDDDKKVWTVLSSLGFEAKVQRLHPMRNAREHVTLLNGIVSQLNNNNLVKDADLDRMDLTRSRRDAEPIKMDASKRALAIETLQELSMITARNAMIDVGAKGTKGLAIVDPATRVERLRMISPELHEEYELRLGIKKIYDAADNREKWPELKSRILRDGEAAELNDLVPAGANRRRRRSN